MPTFSKKQLTDAIREHCYDCNDVRKNWDDPGNDCTGVTCRLYPYRPGNGPGHAERTTTRSVSPATISKMQSVAAANRRSRREEP